MKDIGFSPQELRAAADGDQLILVGRAIVFDAPTVLYERDGIALREVISSTALDGVDLRDIPLRYDHGKGHIILARTRNKSLALERRPDGLHMVAQLQPEIQTHRDVHSAVRSGLLDKMSFAFTVADGGDSYDRQTHTRTITRIKKLFDVSIVNQAAYEQTHVEARSRLMQLADTDSHREVLLTKIMEVTDNMNRFRYMTRSEIEGYLSGLEAEVRAAGPERLRELDQEISLARETITTGSYRHTASEPYVSERTRAVNGEIPGIVVASAKGQEWRQNEKRSDTKMNYASPLEERRDSVEYHGAFYSYMLGRTVTPELRELITTATGAAVVPTVTFNQIVENVQRSVGLLPLIRVLNIPGRLTVPQADINTPAAWVVEGAEIGASNQPPESVTLDGHTLAKLFSMSAATQSMSIAAFEGYLVEELTRCTRDALAQVVFTGTGDGQPLGILTGTVWGAANSVNVPADGSLWEVLGGAMALLPANYRQGAVFVMNSQMFYNYLSVQEDATGQPIFTKDKASGLPLSLMGKPVVVDDFCPDNTVIFGDPRFYFLNFSRPMAVERSQEAGFTKGVIMYRSLAVVDGKPVAPAFVRITRTVV